MAEFVFANSKKGATTQPWNRPKEHLSDTAPDAAEFASAWVVDWASDGLLKS